MYFVVDNQQTKIMTFRRRRKGEKKGRRRSKRTNTVNAHINTQTFYINYPQYNQYNYTHSHTIVQELCESRGGRPGLSVLTSLLVSVDVKLY